MPSSLEGVPAADLAEWDAFERLHGPILLHERLDILFARLAWTVAVSAGAKGVKIQQFVPQWDEVAAQERSDAEVMAFLGAQVKRRSNGD